MEWRQPLARADGASVSLRESRAGRTLENVFTSGRPGHLRAGTFLPDLHLASPDKDVLARQYLHDAFDDWPNNGNVSVRVHHDSAESCGLCHLRIVHTTASRSAGKRDPAILDAAKGGGVAPEITCPPRQSPNSRLRSRTSF